ncbi:MAG: acyl-CoA dehydrogenase family protein [Solirubrobacteraceae bacterium]|nr:acyl-CoA dehydrogenase family protein [Solirubrobacteraceae bacterium]
MPTAEARASEGDSAGKESGASGVAGAGQGSGHSRPAPPLLRTHEEAVAKAREVADELAVGAAERDRTGGVPWEALALLDGSGLLSITVPERLGGPGLGIATLGEAVRLIASADPSLAQLLQPHSLFPIAAWELFPAHGTGQRKLADAILAGGRIGNAVAERGGQHAQDLRVRLERDPASGALTLRGTKYYSTGAISSALVGVTAIDEDERQVLAFVPRDAPGLTIDDDWNVIGQRATVSGTTTLDGVPVDPDLVVDYQRLYEAPQTLGARGQLVHTAIEVGIARGAIDAAAWFVREKARPFFEAVRGGWAERAGDDPHTVYRFGQLDTQVHAAEALLAAAAAAVDAVPLRPNDERTAAEASIAVARAKAFGSEVAVQVSSELFALSGASAADAKHALDRHWRNARTHSIHDPVSWKYHHIGAWGIGGVIPPNHGQL